MKGKQVLGKRGLMAVLCMAMVLGNGAYVQAVGASGVAGAEEGSGAKWEHCLGEAPQDQEQEAVLGVSDLEGAIAALVKGMEDKVYEIDLSSYSVKRDDIEEYMDQLWDVEPGLFYVKGYEGKLYGGIVTTVQPHYLTEYSDAQIQEYRRLRQEIVSTVTWTGMTQEDKALALHDHLATHCSFALEYAEVGEKLKANAYYALVEGSADSDGYARAYLDLLKAAGVTAKTVYSPYMQHRWNVVQIDGEWYHVDVTKDDPYRSDGSRIKNCPKDHPAKGHPGRAFHTFFLLSDQALEDYGEHERWEKVVECTSDRYDEAAWGSVSSAILNIQGVRYSIEETSEGFALLQDSTTVRYSSSGRWYIPGGGMWYLGTYSGLSYDNDLLFFNDDKNIYAVCPGTGAPTVVYTYQGGDGSIFGCQVENLSATILISETPEYSSKDKILTVTINKNTLPQGTPSTKKFFADVEENSWQYSCAKYTYDRSLMKGKGADRAGRIVFDPSGNLTRAEFAQVLYNMEGTPAVTFDGHFPDVEEGKWYSSAITWAYQKGIVSGNGDGRFDVNGKITREQMATMFLKYAAYKGYDVSARADLSSYQDTDRISSWAVENLRWAIAKGVMKGKGDIIDPIGRATRAECAAMLKNFCQAFGQ